MATGLLLRYAIRCRQTACLALGGYQEHGDSSGDPSHCSRLEGTLTVDVALLIDLLASRSERPVSIFCLSWSYAAPDARYPSPSEDFHPVASAFFACFAILASTSLLPRLTLPALHAGRQCFTSVGRAAPESGHVAAVASLHSSRYVLSNRTAPLICAQLKIVHFHSCRIIAADAHVQSASLGPHLLPFPLPLTRSRCSALSGGLSLVASLLLTA